MHRTILFAALAAALAGAAPVARAADGAAVFDRECADCHSLANRQKKGPTLAGVVGRPVASVSAFTNYSDALRAVGGTWTPERLDAYVAAPRQSVPGGTMKYDGLADADERRALVGFLAGRK